MPTTLPRHTITETPEIKAWLDEAAQAWPELAPNRARLFRRLLEQGHDAVVQQRDDLVQRRLKLIEDASGSMPGVWPPGWYERYKQEDWPE